MSSVQPDLTSDLSARQWRWLCDAVSEPVALRALAAASGKGRRPYPLNAAREMGLKLPLEAALPPLPRVLTAEQVQAERDKLRALRASITSAGLRSSR